MNLLKFKIGNFSPVIAIGIVAWVAMIYYLLLSIKDRQTRLLARVLASFVSIFVGVLLSSRVGVLEGGVAKAEPNTVVMLLGAAVAAVAFLWFVDDALPGNVRPYWRYGSWVLIVGGFYYVLHEYVPDHKKCVDVSKAVIAVLAAVFVFYEAHRKGQGRPIAERWKRLVGVSLALAAIVAYFNGFNFGYPRYYHRWDQYHYYMGAKYFPELGYKNLYRCGVVAQYEIGQLNFKLDRPFKSDTNPQQSVDMRKEMRDADKKVRDLPGENLLVPVTDLLPEHDGEPLPPVAAEHCRDRFSDERWEEYKADVAFYRIVSGQGYWTDMQKDHGFNPPPVWTIAGKFFSDLHPASVEYLQFLATLDILYLIGMFIVLWWGFGWRVFACGAIFWGCQSSAPFYWTGGAFLRQDWLFWLVLSVVLIRKRYFKLAGASVVYSALLRVFPGLIVAGTLVPTITYLIKHRRMHRDHLQMLIGGTAGAAVLLAVSMAMTQQPDTPFYTPYKIFYQHTIQTHDKTPLTNHMGLQVIVAHKFFDFQAPGIRSAAEVEQANPNGSPLSKALSRIKWPIKLATGPSSGQMQYVRDNKKFDPFEDWKNMRNERYAKYKPLAYLIILGTLVFFAFVVRNIKSLWVATCLGQIFIILGSQLTCYYYSFMILGAPLIRLRRPIELGLYALAAVTEIIWMQTYWNDNKYTLLTIVSLIFCYVMLGFFYRPWRQQEAAEARKAAA